MKRKYREAMRAAARPWDGYVSGMSDDELAIEALEWNDEYTPPYEASTDHHLDEHQLPF